MYIRLLGGKVYNTKEIEFTTRENIVFTSLPDKGLVTDLQAVEDTFDQLVRLPVSAVESITHYRPK